MHTPNGAGDHIEKMVGRVGMAGETRLIKLDEIDARRNQGLELGADDRNQGLGHGVAIGVDLAPVDAASQCEWPGNRHLYRPPGILPEPVVFRDSSQTVGSRQRLQAAEPLTLVVRRGTPVAGTTNWRQAAQVLVKAEVEIDPLHPPSEMRSSPARNWSSMASRTASRTASSRSTGPNRSGCEPTSPMNFPTSPEMTNCRMSFPYAQILVEKHVTRSRILHLSILTQTWMAGRASNSQEINADELM